MSPLLGFTKLQRQLFSGQKTQTIRKPRKHPIKVGDTLYVYWKLRTKDCEKVGDGIATKVVRKQLWEINNEDAVKDGFDNLSDFDRRFHEEMHPHAAMTDPFDIITWEWPDQIMIEVGCLFCSKRYRGKKAFNECCKHMNQNHLDEMLSARMSYPINYSKEWKDGICYQYIP